MNKKRKIVQVISSLLSNLNIKGFFNGQIYQGPLKKFCVPGMNCYACPAATGACPIGALQSTIGTTKTKVPFYVLGFLVGIGIILGRFVCGWLCLFGLLEELLYKIPTKKITLSKEADKWLRRWKYVMLIVFVILMPIMLVDELGVNVPVFCKYICPVGTLEGGIPLLLLNEVLRPAAHFLFVWKFLILLIVLIMSVFIYRPFCKFICPLGALYSVFNKVSFVQLKVDKDKCIGCNKCSEVCKMQVNPVEAPKSLECIRCGDCMDNCPVKAIDLKFEILNKEQSNEK